MEIENLLNNTMDSLRSVIDVNNVIGRPIAAQDKSVIIPISKVSFGFITGGGEYSETPPKTGIGELPHAGGSGGGVNITPIGFLVVKENGEDFIKVDKNSEDSKWMELIQAGLNVVKDMEKK